MPIETFLQPQGPFEVKYRSSPVLGWHTDVWSLTSNGSMVSSNHYPLNTDIDDGGAWLMSKTEDRCSPGFIHDTVWDGAFTVGNPRSGWTALTSSAQPTDLSLIGKGATAISRSAPNNPAYSVPQAIGELREGFSAIGFNFWKEQTKTAKAAGGEYLSYEFGWKPLVSDLQNFARTVDESARIWNAYKKGSGKKTRVGYHFPEVSDSQGYTGLHIPHPTYFTEGFLEGTTVQYRTRKEWFKGCFKYYIPEPLGFDGKMAAWHSQARKLLGVGLTPDTVWNLNPWTWAADWFANTGDLMTNVSNMGQDGLVLQYGYMMSSEEVRTYTVARKNNATTIRNRITKRAKRISASPYGFGVTLSTLTARQLAIIAALGLGHT